MTVTNFPPLCPSNVALAQAHVLCQGEVSTNWPDWDGVGTPDTASTAQQDPAPVQVLWAKSSLPQSTSSESAWP